MSEPAEPSGALGDYAACAGDDPKETSGDVEGTKDQVCYNNALSKGAMVVASWQPYVTTPNTNQTVITSYLSRTNLASITDGLSNTLLIGEKHVKLGCFGRVGQGQLQGGSTTTTTPGGSLDPCSGDGSIYNKTPWCITRVAGTNMPMARSPSDGVSLQFGSYHTGVCQFVLADGSVHALSVSMNPATLGMLATRNGGEVVGDF